MGDYIRRTKENVAKAAINKNGYLEIHSDYKFIIDIPFEILYDMMITAAIDLSKEEEKLTPGIDRRVRALIKGHDDITRNL